MDGEWFEMKSLRRRSLAAKTWISLWAAHTVDRVGRPGHLGFREEWFGAWSLAVPTERRADAMRLVTWTSSSRLQPRAGYVADGRYVTGDTCEDGQEFLGVYCVLDHDVGCGELPEWHLHQDLVLTLGLMREGDAWIRPKEGYTKVARVIRQQGAGRPARLDVRASHLRDYLCARGMGLAISSYQQRREVVDDGSKVGWATDTVVETGEHAEWRGLRMAIHEGGEPYGSSTHVTHLARTDVNPHDDVPVLGFPAGGNLQSRTWTVRSQGRRLYEVRGELWRTEWLGPAQRSPIVRGDAVVRSVYFIIDAAGEQAAANELHESGRWLWFRPTVVGAFLERRGGSLRWYTRDTGEVGGSPVSRVYFGVNSAGLLHVYARDLILSPEWQQRVWAAHNVIPEGGLAGEAKAAQIDARPASTRAPEARLAPALDRLQAAGEGRLGCRILRGHREVPKLIGRIHRFRAVDRGGLYALAKDVARVTAEDIDQKELQKLVQPPRDEKWGSLVSLGKVLATKAGDTRARTVLRPLKGVYTLRGADAHLPRHDVDEAKRRCHVEDEAVPVAQGFQLLEAAVVAIEEIAAMIETEWQ